MIRESRSLVYVIFRILYISDHFSSIFLPYFISSTRSKNANDEEPVTLKTLLELTTVYTIA